MTVKITPNDKGNPPGKLADAELHFTDGPLEGLKLIGFASGSGAAAGDATSRFRPASTASTASVAASRFSADRRYDGARCVRELILDAYADFEAASAVAS